MNAKEKRHWVFRAHVYDRAGALTSISSAFSRPGVSVGPVVGHGLEERAGVDGSVVLTFFCSRKEKDILVRKVKRLSKVIDLEEHPYESTSLRKSALITTNRKLFPKDVAGEETFITSELVKTVPDGFVYFLAGSPSELDPILDKLEVDGEVTDIVYSIMGL